MFDPIFNYASVFNPVIIIAIIIQAVITKASRLTGAIVGYIITTGILLWGISLYVEGDQIAFFGISISKPVFLAACLVWYFFDTIEFIAAKRITSAAKEILNSNILQNHNVVDFYQNTLNAWSSGKLSEIDNIFEKEGKKQYDDFVKSYLPIEGSALHYFFTNYTPLAGEFMVGIGDSDKVKDSAWFILTNKRLFQRDGVDDSFKEINLAEVESFKLKGKLSKSIMFELKSGQTIEIPKVQIFPVEKILQETISMAKIS